MAQLGIIIVSDDGIKMRRQQSGGMEAWCETTYTEATIENLQDAARVLAAWMDLKYEDVASECRRVHNNDQRDASIREVIHDTISEMSDGDDS